MDTTLQIYISQIARHVGLPPVPLNWNGVDAVWPLLEKMKDEGAVVILKLDGERAGPDDTGPYTALVSGRKLQGEAIRTDATTAEEALSYVICHYAARFWHMPIPPETSL